MNRPSPVTLDDLLRHRTWVRAVAARLARDASEADDLEQATWLAAIEHPPRHGASLRGWLGTVVRNAAKNARRGAGRREVHEAAAPIRTNSRTADELVAEAEAQQVLAREVLDLDEPYRSTVLFRWFEDLTVAQVAERMGVPPETVRTRLRRAVERLRERMDARFGDRRAWLLLVLGRRDEVATGTTAALASAAGGMAMGAAAKWTLGAAVVLLAVGLVWTFERSPGANDPREFQSVPMAAQTPSREAAKPPHRAERQVESVSAPVLPAVPAPVDLARVDRDLDVFGVVVREDGSAVAGAKVQIVSYPWRRTMTWSLERTFESELGPATTSSADGSFALRLARGQLVSLRFEKEGLARLELPRRGAGEKVRAVMAPGVTLVIAAVDSSGEPVADVRLWVLRSPDMGDPAIDRRAVTGPDGTAVFSDLPGACQVLLFPESRLGNVVMKHIDLPKSGTTRFDLVLPPGRTIRGCVTDADTGAAIAGARIGIESPHLQEVTSGSDGSYEFLGWTGADVSASDLHCRAEGYAPWNETVGARESIDFPLHRGFRVIGRLVGPDGSPARGAYVSLAGFAMLERAQRTSVGDARSDASGAFAVAGLRRGVLHVLTVHGPGFARALREVAPPPAGTDELDLGEVRLSVPRAIEGRVTDAAGEPMARAAVTLTGARVGDADAHKNVEDRFTDDLGRFRFRDLESGAYEVSARAANGPAVAAKLTLPADRDVLDLVLGGRVTRAVTVRVLDDAGAPIEGASVGVHAAGAASSATAKSDAHGIARLVAEDTPLDVSAGPSYELMTTRPFLLTSSLPPTHVTQSGDVSLDVVLHEGGYVTGTVLGPDERPVPFVSVWVEPSERLEIVSTDEGGRFRSVLPRTGTFALVVKGYGREAGRPVDLRIEGRVEGVVAGAKDLVIRCSTIATGRTLSFRVTTPDGRPLAGVTVSAGSGTVKSDAEGRGTITDQLARKTHVWALQFGDWLGPEPVELVPNGQELSLVMRAASKITGEVVLADGKPAPYSTVMAYRGEAAAFGASMDAKGVFTLLVPADDPGPFTLKATFKDKAGEYHGEVADVRPGASGIRIVAER